MFDDRPENLVAYRLFNEAINLPSYAEMTDADQDLVIEAVLEVISRYD